MEQPALDEIKVVARKLVVRHALILSKTEELKSDSKTPLKEDMQKEWREWFEKIPWNIQIHLNPRSPFIDSNSVVSLGNQVLHKFQREIFGWGAVRMLPNGKSKGESQSIFVFPKDSSRGNSKCFLKNPEYPRGVFILIPELDPKKHLWHFHGFGFIKAKRFTRDLIKNGDKWFKTVTMNHFNSGQSIIPKRCLTSVGEIKSSVFPRPTTLIQETDLTKSAIGFTNYATKHWNEKTHEKLVCVSGQWLITKT